MSFHGSMAAKKFLVSRIADEAERERAPLTELERKMLFFSENYPTIKDMPEVAAQFESEVNSKEYEKKIAHLSARAYRRDRQESRQRARQWRDAVALLKKEDHYILAMIRLPRVWLDKIRLVFAALLIVASGIGLMIGLYWLRALYFNRMPEAAKWLLLIAGVGVLMILAYNKTGRRVGDAFGRLLRTFLGLDQSL
jgi:hypothetical protein